MASIIRYYAPGSAKDDRLVLKGITLSQAKEWCNNDFTHKAGEWFDGYTEGNIDHMGLGNALYPKYFVPEKQL